MLRYAIVALGVFSLLGCARGSTEPGVLQDATTTLDGSTLLDATRDTATAVDARDTAIVEAASDSHLVDATTRDLGVLDVATDRGFIDLGLADTRVDQGIVDSATFDSGAVDSSIVDSSIVDSGPSEQMICGRTLENQTMYLACPDGMRFTNISFASYGTPTGSCATSFAFTSCHYLQTQSVVSTYCYDRRSCAIPVNNDTFGDDCRGTNKWLAVRIRCVRQ